MLFELAVPNVSFVSVPGCKYVKAPAKKSEVNEVRRKIDH
jgi:hypothetical protein